MSDKMNLVFTAPAIGDALRESINLCNLLLYLTEVAGLVDNLLLQVLSIEMTLTINGAGEFRAIITYTTSLLEPNNTDKLLIQFAGAVVQTGQRAYIRLVDLVVSDDIRVA